PARHGQSGGPSKAVEGIEGIARAIRRGAARVAARPPRGGKELRMGMPRGGPDREERAVYVISVAADLAGVHPQTLRIYERKGLLSPQRTAGNTRRYSERDVEQLRQIQRLTQDEGHNLAGVRIIMEMQRRLDEAQAQLDRARRRMAEVQRQAERQQADRTAPRRP